MASTAPRRAPSANRHRAPGGRTSRSRRLQPASVEAPCRPSCNTHQQATKPNQTDMIGPRSNQQFTHGATGRWMARSDTVRDLLFGVRLDRLRGLPRFLSALRVLRRVLRRPERPPRARLPRRPGHRAGRTLIAVQYWESFDALDAWLATTASPIAAVGGDTCEALRRGSDRPLAQDLPGQPGGYESVYLDVPPWGLTTASRRSRCRRPRARPRRLREQRSAPPARRREPPPPPS